MSARIQQHNRRPAFSLVEALIAATILTIVSASAALPFAAGVQHANEAARLENACALGQAFMEEILAHPFFEPGSRVASPGPDAGETDRSLFDNIDDYHGYTESATGPRDYRNQAITDPAFTNMYREVTAAYITFPGQVASDTNSLIRVTVLVKDGNAVLVKLVRVVARED
ncbi:MAG: prepilin-type N-terminal cleavage/methylation domain-containing protein [Planctomycetota bacterium]